MRTPHKRMYFIFTLTIALSILACGSPDQKKARFLEKGKTLFETGDFVRARLEFKNAVQIDPGFAEGFYMLGMTEVKTGNFKQAYAAFSKAVKLEPDHLKAHLQLGRLFLVAKDYDQAMEKAALILKTAPRHVDAGILKGAVLMAQKKTDTAVSLFENLLERGEKREHIYLLLSSAHALNQNSQLAEKALFRGIALHPESVRLHTALVGRYIKSRQLDDAVRIQKRVAELAPENPVHTFNLAGLLWDTGNRDRAEALLEKIMVEQADNENNRIALARFYISKRQFETAEQTLLEGIEEHKKSFRLRFQLAELYVNLKNPGAAVETLKQCLTLANDPSDPMILKTNIVLARACLTKGAPAEAQKYAEAVLKENPKSVDAHFIKGKILLENKNGMDAVSEFRTVMTEQPGYIPAYLGLAEAHVLNRELDLAKDTLNSALETAPDSREVLLALARVYVLKKDYQDAETRLRQILENHPKDALSHNLLGKIYGAQKQYEKAENAFKRAVELQPMWPEPGNNLARLYLVQGKKNAAREKFETALKANPNNPSAYLSLGYLFQESKENKKAMDVYEKALEKHPNLWVAANNLAALLSEDPVSEDDLERALNLAERARVLRSDEPAVFDTLGWIYCQMGDLKQAVDYLKKALSNRPEDAVFNYHMGMALYKSGRTSEAREKLEKALEKNVDFNGREDAEAVLRRLEGEKGRR